MRVTISCKVCNGEALSRCSGCFSVAYCKAECQKSDWATHKPNCSKPYAVKENNKVGRYMVATRNLKAGDVILREKAAVVGPSLEQSKPICVACAKSLQKTWHLCNKCKAPLCSKNCENHPLHVEECKVLKMNPGGMYTYYQNGTFQKKKAIPENANYQIILPIRAMLLKKQDVKKYKALTSLESHLKEREEMQKTDVIKEKVIPIVQQYKIQEAHDDMLQTLCGIFDTNCFELCPSGAGDTISGVFPSAAMMMHSCYKNSRLTFSDDHVITILARTDIKKGDPIYHTYARTFNSTTIRRIGLFQGKHFGCECVRCKDPTEFNSFSSAVLCSCSGTVIAEDPLDLTKEAQWKCQECSNTIPALTVACQEKDVIMDLNGIQKDDVSGLEDFLSRYRKILHPSHAAMMEVKKSLSVGYGRFPGYTFDKLSMEKLKKKIQFSKEVLDFVTILEPGLSTQKALTLYELWQAEVELWERLRAEDKMTKEEYESNLKTVLKYLEESSLILKYEPENSIHGQLSKDIDIKLTAEKIKLAKIK